MSKHRVGLELPNLGDMSEFKPRDAPPETAISEVDEAARRYGFSTRHAPVASDKTQLPKISTFDARSLRRTNRTAKLNIATTEANRERFWMIAQEMGIMSGDEVLAALMDAWDKKSHG